MVVAGWLHVNLGVSRRFPVDAKRSRRRQRGSVLAIRSAGRVSPTLAAGVHLEVVVGGASLAEGRRAGHAVVVAVHAVCEVVRLVVRRQYGPLQRRHSVLLRAARVPRDGEVRLGEPGRV